MMAANREYAARYPGATKRVIRAILKAADLCSSEPKWQRGRSSRAASPNAMICVETVTENRYGEWREYDPEDTIRFYALRNARAGHDQKHSAQKIATAQMALLNEVKRELKA